MSVLPTPWRFRLYLSDDAESLAAEADVRRICQEHLAGNFDVEVVQVGPHGARSVNDDVLFVPSCVRLSPSPLKTIVAFSSFEKLLV